MTRFFKTPNPEHLATEIKKLWGINSNSFIGPVDTNVSYKCNKIQLVIICESPSRDEINKRYPTVGDTGRNIFNNLVKVGTIKCSEKFSYSEHYQLFELNGIYVTNLVKFQADYKVEKKLNTKNQRVKKAWSISEEHLENEIKSIKREFGNVPILIACGSYFETEIKNLVKMLIDEGLPWYITSHPSRFQYLYSDNYNPETWDNTAGVKTKFAEKIIKYFANNSLNADSRKLAG